ncbi:transcriptional regulator, TetR family [Devosia enhydra]|uniref:Transcriptional regulator, TetR family n=1 Tax=Devosia enhydra TaxID=665118 RepID=A0A1K2HY57_9HYPH|nr:TetR family transcriptional regulator C-terminal domain-containing protein [Devosia enhydra]SFZ84731.1 transcriptional regulator, TetR family [Devosia enhydra]
MPPIKVKIADPPSPADPVETIAQAQGQPVAKRALKGAGKGTGKGAGKPKPLTRIQREKQDQILEAALDIFSRHGFRGATIDQIAEQAGMSKPNLLYYFPRKETIYKRLISGLLETWLAPLSEMDASGDPIPEIRSYIRRKLEMARDFPRESRLFANEMLEGAPRVIDMLEGELKALVDEKAKIILGWMDEGKLNRADPYHLIFAIWATTQHYADFDVQVRAVLGRDRGGDGRYEDAAHFLERLFMHGLQPRR